MPLGVTAHAITAHAVWRPEIDLAELIRVVNQMTGDDQRAAWLVASRRGEL